MTVPIRPDGLHRSMRRLEHGVSQLFRRPNAIDADSGVITAIPGRFIYKVFADSRFVKTGDGHLVGVIPASVDGYSLVVAEAFISAASTSGVITVQIRNVTQAVDMLSTRITIDQGELTSYTAMTPSVINPANAVVATGDLIAVDVDVTGVNAKGLGVVLEFE